jgi:hypothetical protein
MHMAPRAAARCCAVIGSDRLFPRGLAGVRAAPASLPQGAAIIAERAKSRPGARSRSRLT